MYYVNLIIAQTTKKGQTIVRKTLDKTCVLLYSEVRQQTEQLFRVFDTWIAKKSPKVPLGAYFFVKFGNFVLRNLA